MNRALLVATLLLTMLAGRAHADAVPDPGRPDFDDTPLPMPSEPETMALVVLVLAAGLYFALLRRRGQSC